VKHDAVEELGRAAGALAVPLDDEQATKIVRYEEALFERAVPLGLLAEDDAETIRRRHTLDCLRAASMMQRAADAYDLGSGAGLPGIVLAIACPAVRFGLVDSRRKRVAFLEFVIEELRLPNVVALGVRAEALDLPVDICLARAFAPLARAWEVAEHLLRRRGRLVYFAGASAAGSPEEGERAGSIPVPSGARVLDVLRTPVLESAGPLVIMARQ
jgi:16S rRNA (guanine527-N7)-methyltransferase